MSGYFGVCLDGPWQGQQYEADIPVVVLPRPREPLSPRLVDASDPVEMLPMIWGEYRHRSTGRGRGVWEWAAHISIARPR